MKLRIARSVPALYFASSRWTRRTAIIVLVMLVLSYSLQERDIGVPFVPGDAVVRSSALLPILLVIPLIAASAGSMAKLEQTVSRSRLVAARAVWAVFLSILAAVLASVAAVGAGEGATTWMAARNAAALAGAGLIGAAVLGADLAWLPSCLLVVCTFFFGKNIDNEPRTWAWLLHSTQSPGPAVVSVGILLVGCGLFAALDSEGWLRERSSIE